MIQLPPRYEPVHRLGAGGGGEVWSVRDRVSGRVLALKVLSSDAGEPEINALVREAVALSGLEGLGVPRVVAFGALPDGRRYMVRELVEGRSLEQLLQDKGEAGWIEAIASACDQLTIVHRAGLLHGDIKPANIIVGDDGCGTLVDLGLATPWREGGATAQGLTPKYAAPELLKGEPLTVRAEVYALGATLDEALTYRGDELAAATRTALRNVSSRATQASPSSRWPSVDELASALRLAAGVAPSVVRSEQTAWPVLGLDATAQSLFDTVRSLPPRAGVAIEGPRGAGRTTLARRLAWTLGAQGREAGIIKAAGTGRAMHEAVAMELAQHETALANTSANKSAPPNVIVVDDAEPLDDKTGATLRT